MTLKEKAHEYAIDALCNQIKALEDAYLAGYNEAKGIHIIDNVEYIDLGLPSRTLWSTKPVGWRIDNGEETCDLFTYGEALEYNIPTEEQISELRECSMTIFQNSIKILGFNGNVLEYNQTDSITIEGSKKEFASWIHETSSFGDNKTYNFIGFYFRKGYPIANNVRISFQNMFPGTKHAIFLTKTI